MHSTPQSWQITTLITSVIVVAAIVYLRGWLRRRAPVWRACSFLIGLFLIWSAIASPLALLNETMLTGHMVQHLLLMTFAPPLIWLGSPRVNLGKALGHPAFCWLSATVVLITWHVPEALEFGMRSHGWHLFAEVSFLITGLLFWWPVIQPRPPRWSILLYLFLATLPCDVMAGLLVFSDRVVYAPYSCLPQHSGLSALEDQQLAGALMWTCVTVVFLVAGTILATQMLSPRHLERNKKELPCCETICS